MVISRVVSGAAVWTAQQLAHGSHGYAKAAGEGHPLACTLLGGQPRQGYYQATPDALLSLLDGATDGRAQVITLGLVLAAAEAATGCTRGATRTGAPPPTALLAQHGYTLSDVEQLACGTQPQSNESGMEPADE